MNTHLSPTLFHVRLHAKAEPRTARRTIRIDTARLAESAASLLFLTLIIGFATLIVMSLFAP